MIDVDHKSLIGQIHYKFCGEYQNTEIKLKLDSRIGEWNDRI